MKGTTQADAHPGIGEKTMTKRSEKARPASNDRRKQKEHLSDVLDEGLEETFPASDPPAVIGPGHGIPTEKARDKKD